MVLGIWGCKSTGWLKSFQITQVEKKESKERNWNEAEIEKKKKKKRTWIDVEKREENNHCSLPTWNAFCYYDNEIFHYSGGGTSYLAYVQATTISYI